MPHVIQQSSILNEQELALLVSQSSNEHSNKFSIFSYKTPLKNSTYDISVVHTLDQLILLLSASARGSVVILPDDCESDPLIDKLIKLLKVRQDIQILWLGKMPSMDFELPIFIHCLSTSNLFYELNNYANRIEYVFEQWLNHCRVAFVTDFDHGNKASLQDFQKIGLKNITYFDGQSPHNYITNKQLLIIDMGVDELRFVEMLKKMANFNRLPILIMFGNLSENLSRATYQVASNLGFSILASLATVPNYLQWRQLLMSLFADVYLQHWINKEPIKTGAYGVYNLTDQKLESYFCLYGMKREEISKLHGQRQVRKILSIDSIEDWFPDGIKRESRDVLASDLNCDISEVDLYIDNPDLIELSSTIFSVLVMARLSNLKIYWFVDKETHLSIDVLKNFPISDLILSEKISYHLLSDPSDELLEFIEQAKLQNIRLGATLQQNKATTAAMSLYGVDFVLNQQVYIKTENNKAVEKTN